MGYTKPEGGWDKEHLQEPCLNQPPKCKKHLGKTISRHPPKTVKTMASFKKKWSKSTTVEKDSKIPRGRNKSVMPVMKRSHLQKIEWILNARSKSDVAKLVDNLCQTVDDLVSFLDGKLVQNTKVQHSMQKIPPTLIDITKLPDSTFIDLSKLPDSLPQQQPLAIESNVQETTTDIEAMLNLLIPQTTKVESAANILARQFMMLSKYNGNIKLRNVKLNNGQVVKDVPGLFIVILIHKDLEKQGIRMLVDNLRKLETQSTGKEEDCFKPLSLQLD
jgi:hypothetical protein